MNKQKEQIGFAIRSIKTEQFAIVSENYVLKQAINVATKLEFKLDQANKYIGVFSGFDFVQDEKIFLRILVSCHFSIQEKSWIGLKQENSNKIIFPKDFIIHLASLTVGASRGVLSAKAESTDFSNFVIPLLGVAEIISEDIEFDLDDTVTH